MNTSTHNYDAIDEMVKTNGLRIAAIDFHPEADIMNILLNSKSVLSFRLSEYARLKNANLQQLQNFRLIANGTGIHWPEMDEDLSLRGFLKTYLSKQVNLQELSAAS